MTAKDQIRHKGIDTPACSQADVDAPDRDGWTLLMRACSGEPLNTVRALIMAGADVNKGDPDGFGPMMCACVSDRTEIVQYLIKSGAPPDRPDALGRTPLSWTVTKGDFVQTAELLISAGADINRADVDGFTPLMRAALTDHLRCFELLVRRCANTAQVNPHWHMNVLEMVEARGSDKLKAVVVKILSGQHERRSR